MIKSAKSKFGIITFKYEEGQADKGFGEWDLYTVYVLLDGKSIGYLKINCLKKESYNTNFRDITTFLAHNPIPNNASLNIALKTKDSYELVRALSDMAHENPSVRQLERSGKLKSLPQEWWMEKYNKLINYFTKKYKKEVKFFEQYWIDKPIIEYIHVNKEYHGGGVGIGLYIAGATWMKEKGLPLFAGYYQSDLAQRAWNKMEKAGLPVKKLQVSNGFRKYLDYRKINESTEEEYQRWIKSDEYKKWRREWLNRYGAKLDETGRLLAFHGTTPKRAKLIREDGFRSGSYFTLKPSYARHWGISVMKVKLPLDAIDFVGGDIVAIRPINYSEVI